MAYEHHASNLVHESETQRQHVRVRVPGIVEVDHAGGRARFRLIDLSAGGIGFEAGKAAISPGQRFDGRLQLKLEPMEITIPIRCVVQHADRGNGRVGAAFTELSSAEVSSIRRVVTAYLSGEVIGIGDVMHTLSRNNFASPRSKGDAGVKRSAFSRLRAGFATAMMLVIGIVALFFAGGRLQDRLFNTTATAARVSGPQFEITMPRDGVFRSLVPDDGLVKKGAPIGTFETSMLDIVRSQALAAELPPAEMEALLGRSITGTITSPCDCRVEAAFAADGQFLGKGQPVVALAPTDFDPYVVARFEYPGANRLAIGSPVKLRIDGEGIARDGHVTQLRRGSGSQELDSGLVVVVESAEPIPSNLLSRPVKVSARRDAMPRIDTMASETPQGERPAQNLANAADATGQ
jgi:alginate biosynthesis protein Alg44